MLNIKEIALKLAIDNGAYCPKGLPSDWDDGDLIISPQQLQNFAEALIAELAKQNKPVAWWNGKETAFFEHETDWPVGDVKIPLYTIPPTAEQIANETAEACAKACEDVIGNTPHDQRMLAAIDCAVMLRSGAWKEFKK